MATSALLSTPEAGEIHGVGEFSFLGSSGSRKPSLRTKSSPRRYTAVVGPPKLASVVRGASILRDDFRESERGEHHPLNTLTRAGDPVRGDDDGVRLWNLRTRATSQSKMSKTG